MARTDLPVASRVSIESLATLAPQRSTQVIATSKSIYTLQSDSGPSGAVIEIVNGQAVPTPLTSDAVAKSMSLPKARGQITAIAADGDRVAFCYAGVSGQKPVAAIGTFNPVNGEIFTTVDTFSLEQVDPELLTSSARPYLYVSGENAWLVRVEKAALRIITIRDLRALQPKVSAQQIDLGSIQDAITRSTWDFSPAAASGTFYLTDMASRWIRLIDASGKVHHVARFDESIASISPAALDASGRVLVLASDREGVNTKLLIQNGDAFKAISAAAFEALGPDANALRIERLVPIPSSVNRFVAYDGTSGRVIRVSLQ